MASPFRYVLTDRSEPNAPFVICLGWVNCRMRTLQKYGQVMTDMGCPVMLAVAQTVLAFHPLDRAREAFAAKLLDSLLETGACKQRRLVIYCFSNGGAAIEQALVRLMASEQRFKPLQEAFGGVVFDSSPCYMHVMVGARAVAEGQPWLAAAVAQAAFILGALLLVLCKPLIGFWPSRFWAWIPTQAAELGQGNFSVFRFILKALLKLGPELLPSGQIVLARFWGWYFANHFETVPDLWVPAAVHYQVHVRNYAVYHSTRRPELYLYSRNDPLCDINELEPLLAIRESRGGDITRKVWAKSRHVGHLKEHPTEYVTTIQQFFKSKLGFAAPSTAVDMATSSAQRVL